MKAAALALAALLTFSGLAAAADKQPKARDIKTDFGFYTAGLAIFLENAPGYKQSSAAVWRDHAKNADAKSIWAPPPSGFFVADRIAAKMPVIVVSSPDQGCDTAPRLVFLAAPPAHGDTRPNGRLHSYEYNVCDPTGLLSADDMITQYMNKYGVHDARDYDRNMIIYNNVRGNLRVSVKPMEGARERAGVTITVVNDDVFKEVYRSWRSLFRSADKRVKEEF